MINVGRYRQTVYNLGGGLNYWLAVDFGKVCIHVKNSEIRNKN